MCTTTAPTAKLTVTPGFSDLDVTFDVLDIQGETGLSDTTYSAGTRSPTEETFVVVSTGTATA